MTEKTTAYAPLSPSPGSENGTPQASPTATRRKRAKAKAAAKPDAAAAETQQADTCTRGPVKPPKNAANVKSRKVPTSNKTADTR